MEFFQDCYGCSNLQTRTRNSRRVKKLNLLLDILIFSPSKEDTTEQLKASNIRLTRTEKYHWDNFINWLGTDKQIWPHQWFNRPTKIYHDDMINLLKLDGMRNARLKTKAEMDKIRNEARSSNKQGRPVSML